MDEFDTTRCYQYTECGLDNVWLRNGYRKVEREGKTVVLIEDEFGLHRAIGKRVCQQKFINGDEFKFLRREMKMSQDRLGAVLGVSENMVYLWEKRSAIPRQAIATVKAMYLEYIQESYQITKLLNTDSSDASNERIFAEYSVTWELPLAA